MFELDEKHFIGGHCHDLHNPPKPRLTMQEEMMHTETEMKQTIGRMLEFERRLDEKVDTVLKHLTSDNVIFKDTFREAYNRFLNDVKNEVNIFEGNTNNAWLLFKSTIESQYANLSEDCKTQIKDYYNDVILYIKTNINAALTSIMEEMQEDGSLNGVIQSHVFVTPQMYGAKGDGVTDDTVAIQTAINENPDRTIKFVDGVYCITSPIVLENSYVSFDLSANAVIKANAIMDYMLFVNRTAEKNQQEIRGGTWNGNGLANECIHVNYATSFFIKDCVCMDAITANINIDGGYEVNLNDIRIDNTLAYGVNPSVAGVILNATDSNIKQVVVKNCTKGFVFNQGIVAERIHPWCNKSDRTAHTVGVECNAVCWIVDSEIDTMYTGVRFLNYYNGFIVNTRFINTDKYYPFDVNHTHIENNTSDVYVTGSVVRNNINTLTMRHATKPKRVKYVDCSFVGSFEDTPKIAEGIENKHYKVVLASSDAPLNVPTKSYVRLKVNCGECESNSTLTIAQNYNSVSGITLEVMPNAGYFFVVVYNHSANDVTITSLRATITIHTERSDSIWNKATELFAEV